MSFKHFDIKIIFSPICSFYLFSVCFPLWFVPGRIFTVFMVFL